jgi:uncharacterized protein (UPF0335 family)
MSPKAKPSRQERLVHHVHALESLALAKKEASSELANAFKDAEYDGFDPSTLKVVLKLRQLTPSQRQERRALEAIYLAHLGMLDGDALPESARRRFDPPGRPPSDAPSGSSPDAPPSEPADADSEDAPPAPASQPALALKDPEEAKREGGEAAAAGKRIYDNPYPAGDPCRAAWDEGWCAQRKSHGMDLPAAYQRRTEKPADKEKPDKDKKDDAEKKGGA